MQVAVIAEDKPRDFVHDMQKRMFSCSQQWHDVNLIFSGKLQKNDTTTERYSVCIILYFILFIITAFLYVSRGSVYILVKSGYGYKVCHDFYCINMEQYLKLHELKLLLKCK